MNVARTSYNGRSVSGMAPLTVLSPLPPLTLYHDSDSPMSEYALQALQLGSHQIDVRRTALVGNSLNEAELRDLAGRLTGDAVDALVRRNARYRSLGLDLDGADPETIIGTLVDHPELLQAPILDDGTATMIGTSHERADAWAVTGHVVDARPARAA